jgi:hypothetical protein
MVRDRDWFLGLGKKIVAFRTQRRREFLVQFFGYTLYSSEGVLCSVELNWVANR